MTTKSLILGLVLTLFSGATIAGANHDHGHSHDPVTQPQAEQAADRVVAALMKNKVIGESWSEIPVKNAEKKEFDGNMEWVVSYYNESISDPEKRTLYIFLTLTGEYIAANYTGE